MSRFTPFLFTITLVSVVAVAAAWADQPTDQQRPTRQVVDASVVVAPPNPSGFWGLELNKVPRLLRMHVRGLQGGAGMVVENVAPESKASEFGLRNGDVILTINRKPFTSENQLPPRTEGVQLLVMRRGMTTSIPLQRWNRPIQFPGPVPIGGPNTFPGRRIMPPPSQQWSVGPAPMPSMIGPGGCMPGMNGLGMTMPGASASAYASGNESVSVSQVGDQVILEMQSPDIGAGQLRMQGTRQQILDELKDSDLSPAAKQRVRAALR